MTARPAILLLVATLLVPHASADDRRSFPFDGAFHSLPPASEAYILRGGARLEVPSALLLDSGTRATLRLDGVLLGEGSAPGRLLSLDGGPAWIVFDNADTLVPRGGVVSVEVRDPRGLLGGRMSGDGLVGGLLGGLVGGGVVGESAPASRLVFHAAPPPAPPAPPPTPTPPAPTAPTAPAAPTPPAAPTLPSAPTAPATPTAQPPAPLPTPSAPTLPPTAPPAGDEDGSSVSVTEDPEGASNAAAFRAAFPSLRPNVPVPAVMMLVLLAVSAIALVGLVRLGRR